MAKIKISWIKFILILIPVIAVNVVILRWLVPGESRKPKTPPPKFLPEKPAVPPLPPSPAAAGGTTGGEPVTPVSSGPAAARRVAPWDYRRPGFLPAALARRAKGARSGMIAVLETRQVLWSKQPDQPVPVASLTKLMTALLAAEKLAADPNFSWNTVLKAGGAVPRVERSCVLGIRAGEFYAVGELMQSMMINSHNDSAAMLAEGVAGSTGEFVARMNRRGRELGLKSVNFNSPNGLPQGKQRINSFASAADIAHICELLLPYPEVMRLCTMKSARMHTGRQVYSHNNLLLGPNKRYPRRRPVPGLIGFKTGLTNAAGCCLAFGVRRNGRTVIGCVTGFKSVIERDEFCRELIEWAYRKPR